MRTRLQGHGMTPNPEPEILWNFEKFLIGRDGTVVARFAPDTLPESDAIVTAVERELFASE
jgi:glutathione peroxidase